MMLTADRSNITARAHLFYERLAGNTTHDCKRQLPAQHGWVLVWGWGTPAPSYPFTPIAIIAKLACAAIDGSFLIRSMQIKAIKPML